MTAFKAHRIPKVTLEQWLIFQAVVEEGSFAKAADALNKSQSAISYNIAKMQDVLDLKLFVACGRKAKLTELGKTTLSKSRRLVKMLNQLETAIDNFTHGVESKLTLYVDESFPNPILSQATMQFAQACPQTKLSLEKIKSTNKQANDNSIKAKLMISPEVNGACFEKLIQVKYQPYAHRQHELNLAVAPLPLSSLHNAKHIVLKNMPMPKGFDASVCMNHSHIEVDSFVLMKDLIEAKQGIGWLPEWYGDAHKETLKPVNFAKPYHFYQTLYLLSEDDALMGPAQKKLETILTKLCQDMIF